MIIVFKMTSQSSEKRPIYDTSSVSVASLSTRPQ